MGTRVILNYEEKISNLQLEKHNLKSKIENYEKQISELKMKVLSPISHTL